MMSLEKFSLPLQNYRISWSPHNHSWIGINARHIYFWKKNLIWLQPKSTDIGLFNFLWMSEYYLSSQNIIYLHFILPQQRMLIGTPVDEQSIPHLNIYIRLREISISAGMNRWRPHLRSRLREKSGYDFRDYWLGQSFNLQVHGSV